MVRDAEQFAEADRQRREEADIRNSGEQLVFATEKFLAENGEKVPADTKTEVEGKLSDLKGALGGSDSAAIRTAADDLSRASQAMGSAMYAGQQAEPGAPGAAGAGHGEPEDVVDAEVIDEEPHK
jgi:molecular chaperone DnaK